ncbi:unnamed protein product [Meganyctiphanes norvegica]|uniref:Uncharacterized protein n=1 Tax=Meganyctiphanes norvegica TaxID=48144 RepID=A0AAV2QBT2_MEGNR
MYRKYMHNEGDVDIKNKDDPSTQLSYSSTVIAHAHVKAAREGAIHVGNKGGRPIYTPEGGNPRLIGAQSHPFLNGGRHQLNGSARQLKTPKHRDSLLVETGSLDVLQLSIDEHHFNSEAIPESPTHFKNFNNETVPNEKQSESPSRLCRSAINLNRVGPQVFSPAPAASGAGGRRQSAPQVIQLDEFVSRSGTPEFRRRPTDNTVSKQPSSQNSFKNSSPNHHPSPRPTPSPMRLWDAKGYQDVTIDEVIVARPLLEASKTRSPLYPNPTGDLLSKTLLESPLPPGIGRGENVIQVLPAAEEVELLNTSRRFSHHLVSTDTLHSGWGNTNSNNVTPKKRTRFSEPPSEALISNLCCRLLTGRRGTWPE